MIQRKAVDHQRRRPLAAIVIPKFRVGNGNLFHGSSSYHSASGCGRGGAGCWKQLYPEGIVQDLFLTLQSVVGRKGGVVCWETLRPFHEVGHLHESIFYAIEHRCQTAKESHATFSEQVRRMRVSVAGINRTVDYRIDRLVDLVVLAFWKTVQRKSSGVQTLRLAAARRTSGKLVDDHHAVGRRGLADLVSHSQKYTP
jgi:hypothetical protein